MQLFAVGGASLLSALEAREHFGVPAKDAILLATERALSSGMVDEREWREVHPFSSNVRSRGLGRVRAWRQFVAHIDACIGSAYYSRVFVADCGEPMQYIADRSGAGDVVVLDDGLATVVAARARQVAPRRVGAKAALRRVAKGLVAGRRLRSLERVTFFSAYAIEAGPYDTVIRHGYPRLRRITNARGTSKDVLFVGQPFVENGSVSEEDYQELLARAAASLGGSVTYVAHPNESDD